MILIRLLLLFVLLSSCDTWDKLKRLNKKPEFSAVSIPNVDQTLKDLESINKEDKLHKEHIKHTNSLWQPGTKAFLHSSNTWKKGDILTVHVEIKDSAKLNNTTKGTRKSSNSIIDIPKPLNKIKDKLDPFSNKADHVGQGNISRQEAIYINVAVIVQQVLSNGNLFIQGHQEIRVNSELRIIKLAGIIRPKDIGVDNSIHSTKIAEARISYGGKGSISDLQQKKLGNQVLDLLPF